jgi:DNA polymerase III subunit delta
VPDPLLVPLTLVLGDEDLLVSRAVAQVTGAARQQDPEADVREVPGAELDPGAMSDLLAPSLFGERRVLVVRDGHEVAKPVSAALLDYVAAPDERICLVVTHPGGVKGKALADGLRAAGARMIECPRLTRPRERAEFVTAEVRGAGRAITPAAVDTLLETVGTDLWALATAVGQLVADTTGSIDVDAVTRYHRGHADASGFLVADRAVEGDRVAALQLLRWALADGLAPVLVTSSLASNLRTIAKVAAAGRGGTGAQAKRLGLPPWRVERAGRWARSWTPDALSTALTDVAAADAAVKGGAADPAYELERVVARVSGGARGS